MTEVPIPEVAKPSIIIVYTPPTLFIEDGEVLLDVHHYPIRAESGIEITADLSYMLLPLFADKIIRNGYQDFLVPDGP